MSHRTRNELGKIIVVLPAYNCARTLERTIVDIPKDVVDDIVLVDDCSFDSTLLVASKLGVRHIVAHEKNTGYGGNQKTCYDVALSLGADAVIMLHPDYQYDPKLIPSMLVHLANGADVVLASRFLHPFEALRKGMPLYKYCANRILTWFQNVMLHARLSEYHTGYRLYSRRTLNSLNYHSYSDDFVFDNQILIDVIRRGFKVREVYCPARYQSDSSSIGFVRSLRYGFGVLVNTIRRG